MVQAPRAWPARGPSCGPAGSATRRAAGRGAQRAPGVELLAAARDAHAHRRACRRRAAGPARSASAQRAAAPRARPRARRRRVTSPTPTARRWRASAGVPGGNAASSTSMRTLRARSGRGSGDRAVGADGERRRRATPSATTRTRVGKRTRSAGRARRSERIVRGAGVRHCSHAPRERTQPGDPRAPRIAVEGRGGAVAPEPLEARGPVERRRASGCRPRVEHVVGRLGRDAHPRVGAVGARARAARSCASSRARRPAGRARRPRWRSPVTTRGCAGSSPVVRSKR